MLTLDSAASRVKVFGPDLGESKSCGAIEKKKLGFRNAQRVASAQSAVFPRFHVNAKRRHVLRTRVGDETKSIESAIAGRHKHRGGRERLRSTHATTDFREDSPLKACLVPRPLAPFHSVSRYRYKTGRPLFAARRQVLALSLSMSQLNIEGYVRKASQLTSSRLISSGITSNGRPIISARSEERLKMSFRSRS